MLAIKPNKIGVYKRSIAASTATLIDYYHLSTNKLMLLYVRIYTQTWTSSDPMWSCQLNETTPYLLVCSYYGVNWSMYREHFQCWHMYNIFLYGDVIVQLSNVRHYCNKKKRIPATECTRRVLASHSFGITCLSQLYPDNTDQWQKSQWRRTYPLIWFE